MAETQVPVSSNDRVLRRWPVSFPIDAFKVNRSDESFNSAEERETVQKKTFTKWVNSHLVHVNCRINDLYVDMRDGKNLLKLLEILSGERLPRPTKGKMRIHCLENVDKALQFLRDQRVHLENIGAHDIVDFSRPSVSSTILLSEQGLNMFLSLLTA